MTDRRALVTLGFGTAMAAAGLGVALLLPATAAASPSDDPGHTRGPSAAASGHRVAAPSRKAPVRSRTPARTLPTSSEEPRRHSASAGLQGSSPNVASAKAVTSPAPGPIQAAFLAMQAYVYGYPLLEFEKFRSEATALNTISIRTGFASPDAVPIWRPNADTFYSRAILDLSNGPVVLTVPDMGERYYSLQFIDPYTNVVDYIGTRSTGSGAGTYALTWAGGPQAAIAGAQTVTLPYPNMVMLGRTLVGDAADQQRAVALMRQFTLTPTGATAAPPAKTDPPTGLALLDAISAALEINPPPAADAAKLAAVAQIGVGPGLRVADAHLGPLASAAIDLAVRASVALLPLLSVLNQYESALVNRGWAVTPGSIGRYGTDYQLRAGVAYVGPWANIPDEAVYAAGLLDKYLLPLNGSRDYVMHFAPGQQPPAGAFWSVTVYDPSGQFVRNSLNRYSISSSRPDELVYRPDGSIDIVFAQRDPGDPGANWLPIPNTDFSAYLRVYVPGQAVLDGRWTPPPIEPRTR